MSKREAADRKARLEQIRKEQQAVERRRTLLVIGAAGVLVLVLVAAVVVVIRNQLASSDITKVGALASAAACEPITTDKVTGSTHVGPGTESPNVTKVDYATVPPTSGNHFVSPEVPARAFYTADDRPAVETLVHNQEHGYTILWYDPSIPAAEVDQLKTISTLGRKSDNAGDKFIVAPLDVSRGKLPAGKTVALVHWSAKEGHRQICGKVSGEAVQQFVKKYPSTDAPEPGAA